MTNKQTKSATLWLHKTNLYVLRHHILAIQWFLLLTPPHNRNSMNLALKTTEHLPPICALLWSLLHHWDTKEAQKELQDVLGVKSKIHRFAIIRCPKTYNTSKDQKTNRTQHTTHNTDKSPYKINVTPNTCITLHTTLSYKKQQTHTFTCLGDSSV